MKKSYRIKKEIDFQKIMQQKNSFANRNLVIYCSDNPSQKHFRVGLSVGKKIGNAVMRNKVKRQIRQALLELTPELNDKSLDLIVIARPNITSLSTKEVQKNLEHVLKLAKIL